MSLTIKQSQEIQNYLIEKIRGKLATYNPETRQMPFHYRLLGKDRMALFSFIHSVNTTLGVSIFEQVGKIIVEPRAKNAIGQYNHFEGYISDSAVLTIDKIMRDLRSTTRKPNKKQETKEVLNASNKGEMGKKIKKRVDLFVQFKDGVEYYFELKSAKPNINEFMGIKKQMLDLIAIKGSNNPKTKIKTIVAIPYNPYEPEPYDRWTLQGLFDLKEEVMVGKEFWDFLGGNDTYKDLLTVFENAGLELYDEIDAKMRSLR